MSPKDFDKAWKARNQRLRDAGVFDHVDELSARYGWDELNEMTPNQLIGAVAEIADCTTAEQ